VLDRPVERAPLSKRKEWRFLGRTADFWTCAAITLVVMLVQAWNIAGYPAVFDDEGTYLAQSYAIDHGIGLAPYTYWFDHPPLGWIQLSALAWIPGLIFHSPGQLVVAYSRIIMLPFTAASMILMFVLARRLKLPRWAAVLAVALFGLSPLSVTLQREIFLDNISVTWMLAAFVLAYSQRKHLWHHVAAGLCAGIAVLSKETMLLVMPALIVALWANVHKTTRKYSFVGFIGAFLLLLVQYPLYATLKGELYKSHGEVSLWSGIHYQLTRPGSGSLFNHKSSAYDVVHNWLFYDPILIVAGTVAVVLCLAFRNMRPVAIGGAILVLTVLRPSGYIPSMYIIQMLPFFALCTAGLTYRVFTFILTWKARPVFWQQVTRLLAVALCVVAVVTYVVPKWYSHDHDADTQDLNAGYSEAMSWIATHIPKPGNKRIAVDDTLWLDMVREGFKPGRRDIYFFKLDVDPDVMNALPGGYENGWKSIQYMVVTPYMYENQTCSTGLMIKHSKVLWSYGTGDPYSTLTIRKVIPAGPSCPGPSSSGATTPSATTTGS
jgi:4-amino-4-deoxy-L-arabinose transferase-like glycosyltransferase